MDPAEVAIFVSGIPYVGRFAAWVPVAVVICTWVLAPIMTPPTDDSGFLYRLFYRVVNIVARNFGTTRNSNDPVAQAGVVSGLAAQATITTGLPYAPKTVTTEAGRADAVADIVGGQTTITEIKTEKTTP